MIGTLSKHKAEAAGFADAMMLDWRGRLSEATGANVFLAIDGALHTPTPDCFSTELRAARSWPSRGAADDR
jgi:branched-chain amino acid aminotransferase